MRCLLDEERGGATDSQVAQANFFRNIGTILTFAFAGTFISALVLGVLLWLWTRIPLDFDISFVEAISVGATLSATDPVTILAIFTTYRVDPKLYTVIFGESILSDAVAIVLYETAQKYKEGASANNLSILSLFESIGVLRKYDFEENIADARLDFFRIVCDLKDSKFAKAGEGGEVSGKSAV